MEQIEIKNGKRTGAQWCVVFTAPHAEQRVQRELETKGIECMLPLYTRTACWRGKKLRMQAPRFARCIFVRICQADIPVLTMVPELIVPCDILDNRCPVCLSDFCSQMT